MPELPEVETIRKTLLKHLVGKKIKKVKILLPRLIKIPSTSEFQKRIKEQKITSLERSGKYLRLILEDEWELIFHFRMTGRLVYEEKEREKEIPHTHVIFFLSDSSRLVYRDIRTFGTIYLVDKNEKNLIKGLSTLGTEPLSRAFTLKYLGDKLAKRKKTIKSFLLDQTIIAGLGNIYVDEALFLAGIHPKRLAMSLEPAEIKRLHKAVNTVIKAGIKDGGTSFRDYVNGDGEKGRHQNNLKVYMREGTPCDFCGKEIEKIIVDGRGTRFCPACQKIK